MPATCVGGRDATGMANVATGPTGAGETFRRQGDSTGVENRLLNSLGNIERKWPTRPDTTG